MTEKKEDTQKLVDDCTKELTEVLNKHKCILTVEMVVGVSGNRPIVTVVPNKEAKSAIIK